MSENYIAPKNIFYRADTGCENAQLDKNRSSCAVYRDDRMYSILHT